MPDLVLLRHGQSTWNAENLFTGWEDVDLTDKGEAEAREAGRLFGAEAGLDLRIVHTSVLVRAIRTANLALKEAGRSWIPVRRDWRLNERHYGDLQGKDKKEVAEQFGEEQLVTWRRGYETPPPPLAEGDPRRSDGDLRYREVPAGALPVTECLADVVNRVARYFDEAIAPDLRALAEEESDDARIGAVLVVAHGNSLRALRKHLEHISDEDIVNLEIPTGYPFVYRMRDDLSIEGEGRYLGDPEAVGAAMDVVRRQAG